MPVATNWPGRLLLIISPAGRRHPRRY